MSKKQFWDHSSKPSVFVEITDGVETYRGPFRGAEHTTEIEEIQREHEISDTPETDLFRMQIDGRYWVPEKTSRRIELDRNAARKLRENALANLRAAVIEGRKAKRQASQAIAKLSDAKAKIRRQAERIRKLEGAGGLRERDEAREALREIASADWKTSGELRGMARRVLEGEK